MSKGIECRRPGRFFVSVWRLEFPNLICLDSFCWAHFCFDSAKIPAFGERGLHKPILLLLAALANLFFGEAVEWWRGNFKHGEININLSAMMDFMFDHEAEPFPEGDACAIGSDCFFVEIGVGERAENFHGFLVEAIHVIENIFKAFGERAIVARIAAGLEARVFGPHESFGAGDVAQEIAECEAARFERPFDLRSWNAAGDAESAGADFGELVGELKCFGVFHLLVSHWKILD